MYIKNFFMRFRKYNHFINIVTKCSTNVHHIRKYCNNLRNISKVTKIPPNYVHTNARYCTEVVYSSDSDNDIDSEDYIEESEFNNGTIPTRQILNANVNDPLIAELNTCASVQEVFNVIKKHEDNMDSTHISQAVLVLWDLQKCFYKHNLFYHECNINRLLKTNDLLRNYIIKVKTHDNFVKLLDLVEKNYKSFSMDALTCCLIYLNRMGVELKHDLMQKLIIECEQEIKNRGLDFPLTALSRFTVALYGEEDNMWALFTSRNTLPIVLSHLDTCDSAQDFKLITICLNKMYKVVTESILNKYKEVVNKFIDKATLTYSDPRTVLKAMAFLNKPHWVRYNSDIIKRLFYIFKKHVHILSDRELIVLFKIFQMQKEPADMLDEIQESASNRLSVKNDLDQNLELTLDLLSCVVSFTSPLQRPKFEQIARQYVKNSLTSTSLTSLYKILYHIKSSDITLCNTFWDKTLTLVKVEDSKIRLNNILNLCHKYMHFNREGHHYRYYNFERTLTDLLLYELEFGIANILPNKFSRTASFIIAYNTNPEILETVINHCKEISHQFSAIDCLNLSKAIQIATENSNFKNSTKFNAISTLLNERIDREIQKSNINSSTINILLRGYTLRKGDMKHERFKKMLHFCSNENQFTTNILKELSFMMHYNSCLVPDLIENMLNYIMRGSRSILGSTVDKILYMCYYLGYTPRNEDSLNICSELIIRDKERFSGLSFIQAALALCYFNNLPEFLVKHIFSVDFLEKLDEELSHCYSKTTYPVRVRDNMMQLNRAVCLDYIECDVPWFHQKYIEQRRTKTASKSIFHQKVQGTLLETLKKEESITENVFTPYGYHLDFEINLEKEGHNDNSNSRKIAVNILPSKAHTTLNRNLKGYYQLKRRHLEILGYEVFYEDQQNWAEFYTQGQSIKYMINKIRPSSINIKSDHVL